LELLRRGRESEPLTIDIQTRRQASAYDSTADLVFRTVAPDAGRRLPDAEVWEDLQRLLSWLADAVATHRPPEVHVTGAGHLGIGVALGSGLPETAGTPIAVQTSEGVFRRARRNLTLLERLPLIGVRPRRRRGPDGTGQGLAVYVDVSEFPGQPTFREWLATHQGEYRRSILLSRTDHFDPDRGSVMSTVIARTVRETAAKAGTSEVLLFAHTAWPLAVLLGAALNTLTVRIFEWDNSTGSPVYVEVATVRPGSGGGPVIDVVR
jgi:hypothetical protein